MQMFASFLGDILPDREHIISNTIQSARDFTGHHDELCIASCRHSDGLHHPSLSFPLSPLTSNQQASSKHAQNGGTQNGGAHYSSFPAYFVARMNHFSDAIASHSGHTRVQVYLSQTAKQLYNTNCISVSCYLVNNSCATCVISTAKRCSYNSPTQRSQPNPTQSNQSDL